MERRKRMNGSVLRRKWRESCWSTKGSERFLCKRGLLLEILLLLLFTVSKGGVGESDAECLIQESPANRNSKYGVPLKEHWCNIFLRDADCFAEGEHSKRNQLFHCKKLDNCSKDDCDLQKEKVSFHQDECSIKCYQCLRSKLKQVKNMTVSVPPLARKQCKTSLKIHYHHRNSMNCCLCCSKAKSLADHHDKNDDTLSEGTVAAIVSTIGVVCIVFFLLLLAYQRKLRRILRQSLQVQPQRAQAETGLVAIGQCPTYQVLDGSGTNTLYWREQDLPTEIDEDAYELPFEPPPGSLLELFSMLSKGLCRHIRRDNVMLGERIGRGQFGEVRRGTWTQDTLGEESVVSEIAVKSLKAESTEPDRVKFLQEAVTMAQFKHRNVMALHGATIESGQLFLILELLRGDLRSYLIELDLSAPTEELIKEFPLMIHDVASGMAYLGKRGFVHRDVAARNVMVSEQQTCKIGDFGMSRHLDDNYYYVSHGGMIPLRWSAPEAVYFSKFSTASDVWSFGIVLYEIYELGKKPYASWSNEQTMSEIADGYRLPKPHSCPSKVYELMLSCWDADKNLRPSFDNILERLEEIFPELQKDDGPNTDINNTSATQS